MSAQQLLEAYVEQHAPASRRIVRLALERIASVLEHDAITDVPWSTLPPVQITSATRALTDHWSPATARQAVSFLRGWLRYLGSCDPAHDPHYALCARAIARPRGSRLPRGRELTHGEIAALFLAAEQCPNPTREACILALGIFAGLRRAEIASLEWCGYDRDAGGVTLIGKGNRERFVPLPRGAMQALHDHHTYLCRLQPIGRHESRPIIGLTAEGIRTAFHALALDARIARCSPHDMRRTYITSALRQSRDLAAVQHLAGHASPLTTTRYNMDVASAAAAVAHNLHCPYRSALPELL